MKKVKVISLIAAFLGIFSSFAFRPFDSGEVYIKLGTDQYALKSAQTSGECEPQNNSACDYILMDGLTPDDDDHFTSDPNDNEVWVP